MCVHVCKMYKRRIKESLNTKLTVCTFTPLGLFHSN